MNHRRQMTKNKWFDIRNRASTDTADVYIYDLIDSWGGVGANDLIEQLQGLSASNITVHLNSPGGDAFEGLTIMNALKKLDANVTVEIDGMAASAGSIIAMAGDTITMSEGAMLMIHQPWTGTFGNATELRQQADFLDKLGGSLAQIYANRAGGTAEEWSALMDAETWFNAAEAVEAGLADATTSSKFQQKNPVDKQQPQNNDLILKNQLDLLTEIKASIDRAETESAKTSPEPETYTQDAWASMIKVNE